MEAAGLASSIITFIDFSYKIVIGTVDVYKKASTGPAADPHINTIINDLEDVTRNMTTASPASPTAATVQGGSHQEALLKLAAGCNELSITLIDILKDLERKSGGNKLWRSLQASWATMRSSDKIVDIEQKLNTYRLQLLVRLSMMISGDITSTKSQLDQLHQGNEAAFGETVTELRSLRDDMKRLDGNIQAQAVLSYQTSAANPDQVTALSDLREELSRITRALETMRRQSPADLQILAKLRFAHVHSRLDSIVHGEFRSFTKLLGNNPLPPEDNSMLNPAVRDAQAQEQKAQQALNSWLAPGSNLLHISGKAGSGKSTLMKMLANNRNLDSRLREWASDSKLVVAHFFFWLSGDALQNSLEGLYRSMLLEVLQQCPELTKLVFPKQWREISERNPDSEHTPFRLFELQDATSRLVEGFSGGNYRFCFFIDGLDEYAGDSMDHLNLARQLRQWAKSPHIKICASSRPYQEFHNVFHESTRIDLHELTGPDILSYCQETLNIEGDNRLDPDQIKSLAYRVKGRSDGVFLWTRLVVRSLCEGILHFDAYETLLAKLDEAPSDLMQLFHHLFNKINPVDRTRAYQLLFLVSTWNGFLALGGETSPNAMLVSWIEDVKDVDFPYNRPRVPLDDEEVTRRIKYAGSQLKLTCRGLLELGVPRRRSNDIYFQQSVRFLHRTVSDFLHQPEMVSVMQNHLGENNLGSSDYLRLVLAEFKFARLPRRPKSDEPGRGDVLFWCYYGACQAFRLEPRALEECEKILQQLRQEALSTHVTIDQGAISHNASDFSKLYIRKPTGDMSRATISPGITSHIHLLAYFGASPDFVLARVMAGAYDRSPELCLISSTIWNGIDSKFELSLLRRLMDHGFDLTDRLSLWYTVELNAQCHLPGWIAFLVLLGNECSSEPRSMTRDGRLTPGQLFAALEILLVRRSRADLDVRMEFHVHDISLDAWVTVGPGRGVTMTLEEVIILMMPPNTENLLREIGSRKTWSGWAEQLASRMFYGLSASALSGVKTSPTRPAAPSTVLEVVQKAFEGLPLINIHHFGVKKIWVGDTTYEIPGLLSIRLF
ncbi:hypothetical protein F5X68DRAFT_228803 [Plectosphaerella plurivora]|uniref:NACHT domain-containing protein n=1 Tax=Plectosphaerella plurivora TaxID=936078 RepID=A0A9P8VIP9_9PEZI|nr:hypothetical protein F5X68DRAFT_228803 [Plectosphaerella plurivora]